MPFALDDPTPGRRRFGVVVPSVNTVVEPEFSALRPAGTSFHFARVVLRKGSDRDELAALRAAAPEAVRQLVDTSPEAVILACTSGTMSTRDQSADELRESVAAAAGFPLLTTAQSVLDAFRALGAEVVSVATPYLDWVGEEEAAFFRAEGFEVAAVRNLGITDGHVMAALPVEAIVELAESVDAPESDLIFLSCTDLPTFGLLAEASARLGKPVVSSNAATLWRLVGRNEGLAERLGTLFGHQVPQPAETEATAWR
jgi:maleate cis-trans isomerase